MLVQRLKVAILPLDLAVTHSGEILTTDKSHGKKLERFSINDDTDVVFCIRFLLENETYNNDLMI